MLSDKRGKMNSGMKGFVWVIGIVFVAAILWFSFGPEQSQAGNNVIDTEDGSTTCSSDLTWSGTVDVQNLANTSGAETFDTTMYFYLAGTNTLKTSITDTTAGSLSLTCGEKYDIRVLSTSGAAGDSGKIKSVSEGTVSSDGVATFTAKGTGNRITVGMNQHGVPEIQVFDEINNAYMMDASGGTTYNATDPTQWNGTAYSNTIAVGAGGELDLSINLRSTVFDEDFNDYGILVLVDAGTSVWDTPSVSASGIGQLSDIKGSLNPDEAKAYSGYEYVFLIPDNTEVSLNKKITLRYNQFALGGVNPTAADNISIDYSVRGTSLSSVTSNLLVVGAVQDNTAQTQVYGLHDNTFSIS